MNYCPCFLFCYYFNHSGIYREFLRIYFLANMFLEAMKSGILSEQLNKPQTQQNVFQPPSPPSVPTQIPSSYSRNSLWLYKYLQTLYDT